MMMKCPKCGSENITQENKGQETAEILIKNGVKVVGYTIAKALGHRKIGKMLFSHETSTTKKYKCNICERKWWEDSTSDNPIDYISE
jgi:DNA-directed RNA polymerase subunit RPC12/RpoP